MFRTAALASCLLLVACSSEEKAEPGGPCKADLTCGSGLVCNFQAATPVCLDGDLDEDSDGLANKQDFCPATAGGSNHDEDGDGQGDACDLCPIQAARGVVKDEDGDKLGGSCDPDDKSPGDKLIYFETFADANALNDWTLDDATHYTVSGDQLKVTVNTAQVAAQAFHALPIAPQSAAVFTAYRIDNAAPPDVSNTSRDVAVEIYDNSPAGQNGRARCGSSSAGGAAGELRLITDRGEATQKLVSSFVTNDRYSLLLQVDGGTAFCVHIQGDAAASTSKEVEGGPKPAVAVGVRGVNASYDYIMVVQSPLGR